MGHFERLAGQNKEAARALTNNREGSSARAALCSEPVCAQKNCFSFFAERKQKPGAKRRVSDQSAKVGNLSFIPRLHAAE